MSGEVVGILSTGSRTEGRFSQQDLEWLDLLARQAADIIERRRHEDIRSRLNDELDRRVRDRSKWLTLLHDVSQAIDQAPTWIEALHQVMRRICEVEDWQAGYVYLPAPDSSELLVAAVSYSPSPRFASFHAASEQKRYPRGQSLPGLVFKEGHHIWVNDGEAAMKLLSLRAEAAAQCGIQSAVAFPVQSGNETLAVVEFC